MPLFSSQLKCETTAFDHGTKKKPTHYLVYKRDQTTMTNPILTTVKNREEIDALIARLRKPKTRGNVVKAIDTCDREIGVSCPKDSCADCKKLFTSKKVGKIQTALMGNGLGAIEDITAGDYICKYTGVWLKQKPVVTGDYLASVRMGICEGRKEVNYIDATNARSFAKYCNHSCDFNAVFSEVMTKTIKNPTLWIKVVKDIKMEEEIFVDYGHDFLNYINEEKGGCKCPKCYNGGV